MRDCDHGERRLAISTALVDDSSIEVSVADTGSGIPPDKLNTIFDTFYTTKGHGTCLGLTITRTIVQTFGGRVWAENRPGGGCGAAFFVIESGGAAVFIGGKERTILKPGDYFGEIALIDEGTRMATITASSELVWAYILGLPPTRREERCGRLEAAAADGEDATPGRGP